MNFTPVDNQGRVDGYCLVKSVETKTSSKGDTYLDFTLGDSTGEINGKLWRYVPSEHGEYKANDLVKIRGTISQYNGADQLRIERIRPTIESDNVRIEDFVRSSGYSSEQMYEELMNKSHDAHTLSSGTIMENIYADYANTLHAMANTARKEAVVISPTKKNPQAAKTYAKEVESVNNKLGIILRNKPIERQAQLLANSRYRVKVHDNPDMTKEEKKKLRNQLLSGARAEVGSTSKKERELDLTDREWDAINAGAFSSNQLKSIIDNFDEDKLKKQAMPREQKGLPDSKISLIKTMASGNYTTAEIADRLGVSTATVSKYMGA